MTKLTLPSLPTLLSYILLLATTVIAAPSSIDDDWSMRVNGDRVFTTHAIILAIICFVVGIVFLFAGLKFFPIVTGLAGFYVFSVIGYIILTRLEPDEGYTHRATVLLIGSLAIGLLGLFLGFCLWQLGVAFIGGIAGFSLAMWLLSLRDGGLIHSEVGRIILVVALVVVGIVLVFVFERLFLIIATSIIGAYLITFGIDLFAQTGFIGESRAFLRNIDDGQNHFTVTSEMTGVLVTFAVLTVIGIVVQWFTTRAVVHSHAARGYRVRRAKTGNVYV
ncbi:hypothetical protein HK104_010101 [Borealophlyctis nickersoniae]|nr:hypothetical protein HK104_010101 [Borealophlyctis nickersoniae]